jgi:hypothetical protein
MADRPDTAEPIAFPPCAPGGRRPERIDELLSELADYWRLQPHLRLGQIIDNFARALGGALDLNGDTVVAARELEDDALLGMLRTGLQRSLFAATQGALRFRPRSHGAGGEVGGLIGHPVVNVGMVSGAIQTS